MMDALFGFSKSPQYCLTVYAQLRSQPTVITHATFVQKLLCRATVLSDASCRMSQRYSRVYYLLKIIIRSEMTSLGVPLSLYFSFAKK